MAAINGAFKELRALGLAAHQDWQCCQTCGLDEIMTEVDSADKRPRGYVFYHEQDADMLIKYGSCCVAYGSTSDDATDADAECIGREVAETLQRHGCRVEWDGTCSQRIAVWCDVVQA